MLLSISLRVVGVVSVLVELEAGDLGSGSSEGCLGYGFVDGGGCVLNIGSGSFLEIYWHGGCSEGRGCPCGSSCACGTTRGFIHVHVHVHVGIDMTSSDDCLRKQEHGDHRHGHR